jgi:hypothetical protein
MTISLEKVIGIKVNIKKSSLTDSSIDSIISVFEGCNSLLDPVNNGLHQDVCAEVTDTLSFSG